MSPAGAAVLGNVLVEDVGQVVGAVDVIPDPLFWQIDWSQVPRSKASWHRNLWHKVWFRSDRARSGLAYSETFIGSNDSAQECS